MPRSANLNETCWDFCWLTEIFLGTYLGLHWPLQGRLSRFWVSIGKGLWSWRHWWLQHFAHLLRLCFRGPLISFSKPLLHLSQNKWRLRLESIKPITVETCRWLPPFIYHKDTKYIWGLTGYFSPTAFTSNVKHRVNCTKVASKPIWKIHTSKEVTTGIKIWSDMVKDHYTGLLSA